MQIFQNRPLATSICLASAVALAAWRLNGLAKCLLIALLALLGGILLLLFLGRRRLSRVPTVLMLSSLLTAALLVSSACFFNLSAKRMERLFDQEITVEGYVLERLDSSNGESCFSVRITEIEGERARESALLEVNGSSPLQSGDRFRATGAFRQMQDSTSYREDVSLYSDGYAGVFACSSETCQTLEGETKDPSVWFLQVRNRLSHRLRQAIGGEEGALAAALLLGDRAHLSENTVLAFRRAGVSHLLALSGLHVSILMGLLHLLLAWLPRRWRMAILPVIVPFYLLLTGCSPSAARAALMAIALSLGLLLQRRYDSFTGLSTALWMILLIWPNAVLSASLWLSFSAAAAIVIFVPSVGEWVKHAPLFSLLPKWIKRGIWTILSALLVGLYANAGVLPLSAHWFGSVSALSVPVTLLLSPLVTIALWTAPFVLLLPRLTPLASLCRLCLKGLLWGVESFSDVPNSLILTDGVVCQILLAVLILSLAVVAVLRFQRKGWLLTPILLSALVLLAGYADRIPDDKGIGVTYVRKNETEAILLTRERESTAILLSNGSTDVLTPLLNALNEARCTELTQLVLPEYSSRSTYLLHRLSGEIKIRELLLETPRNETEEAIADRLEQEARLLGIPVQRGTDSLAVGEVEMRVVTSSEEKDPPMRILMTIKDQTLVYLGAGEEGEETDGLSRNLALSADILVLGAHGDSSETPSMPPCNARVVLCGELADWTVEQTVTALPQQILIEPLAYRFFLP